MTTKTDTLAIDGGAPRRDAESRPWPKWPLANEDDWRERFEPALRRVYLSSVEGMPHPTADAFAAKLAAYCGAAHGRMLVHGTDAITAALVAALDLDAWDEPGEVIVPNYTYVATASAAIERRCSVAFVDIDPVTFCLDPEAFEAAIVPGRTRAVIPVHVLGHPANMSAINAIAKKHGIAVIEDCAQAHGAICEGRKVGSWGDAGAFSFQSSKNLCSGEGGAVITNDAAIDARIVAFMDVGRHPQGERWEYPRLGWNYRPSEYLAALLTVRLEDLEEQTCHRTRMADLLRAKLAEVEGITPARSARWCSRHAYHLYGMLYDPAQFGGKSRSEFVAALQAEGIPSVAGYTSLLSDQAAFQQQLEAHPETIRVTPCPNTSFVCDHTVWLYQWMLLGDEEDMADIVGAIGKIQSAFRT